MIFHYNTVKIEYNDGLFLDVNWKRPFLDIQYRKFQRLQNLRNVLKKKVSEWFGYINIDFISSDCGLRCNNIDEMINQENYMTQLNISQIYSVCLYEHYKKNMKMYGLLLHTSTIWNINTFLNIS